MLQTCTGLPKTNKTYRIARTYDKRGNILIKPA